MTTFTWTLFQSPLVAAVDSHLQQCLGWTASQAMWLSASITNTFTNSSSTHSNKRSSRRNNKRNSRRNSRHNSRPGNGAYQSSGQALAHFQISRSMQGVRAMLQAMASLPAAHTRVAQQMPSQTWIWTPSVSRVCDRVVGEVVGLHPAANPALIQAISSFQP